MLKRVEGDGFINRVDGRMEDQTERKRERETNGGRFGSRNP